jgi:hypothetical protein
MTLTIDLSKELEAVLKTHALAQGVDAACYAGGFSNALWGWRKSSLARCLKPAEAGLPNTHPPLRLRKSTRTGPICSAASVRMLRDRRRCRYGPCRKSLRVFLPNLR